MTERFAASPQFRLLRLGSLALAVAPLLVGLAILLDGAAARAVNGVGGLLWLAAAGTIAWSLRRAPGRLLGFATVLVAALILVLFVRPFDVLMAVIGFGLAGALVAMVGQPYGSAWARLLPAVWLPLHLLVRVVPAVVGGEAAVRSTPPPTAALVPLAMVASAWLAGLAVQRLAGSRPVRRPRITRAAGGD